MICNSVPYACEVFAHLCPLWATVFPGGGIHWVHLEIIFTNDVVGVVRSLTPTICLAKMEIP